MNAFAAIPSTRVSSLTTAPTLPTSSIPGPGTLTLNTGFVGTATGPSVQANSQVAVVDPTALAQTDRTLMDLAGGACCWCGAVSTAGPTRRHDGDGCGDGANAGPYSKAPSGDLLNPAPITVWVNSFGGRRIQDETSSILGSTSNAWGVAWASTASCSRTG